jgi:hypothetical protein
LAVDVLLKTKIHTGQTAGNTTCSGHWKDFVVLCHCDDKITFGPLAPPPPIPWHKALDGFREVDDKTIFRDEQKYEDP